MLALKRSEVVPDVPTYTELGFPEMGDGGWFGLVAPAGTPKAIIDKLNAAAHKAMQDPGYLAKQIDAAIARYTAVAKRANIKVN